MFGLSEKEKEEKLDKHKIQKLTEDYLHAVTAIQEKYETPTNKFGVILVVQVAKDCDMIAGHCSKKYLMRATASLITDGLKRLVQMGTEE